VKLLDAKSISETGFAGNLHFQVRKRWKNLTVDNI